MRLQPHRSRFPAADVRVRLSSPSASASSLSPCGSQRSTTFTATCRRSRPCSPIRGSRDADLIVSGGDLVAGPMPSACLDLLAATARGVRFVRGNADRNVLERGETHGGAWCADELGPERLAAVAEWPLTIELDVAGGDDVLSRDAALRRGDRHAPDARRRARGGARRRADAPRRVPGTRTCRSTGVAGGHRFVVAGSVGRPYEGSAGRVLGLARGRRRAPPTPTTTSRAQPPRSGRPGSRTPRSTPRPCSIRRLPDEVSAYFESLRGA